MERVLMSSNEKHFINSKELSERISLPITAIQRLVRQQRIPAYKLDSKQYLFVYEEVYKAIKDRKVN